MIVPEESPAPVASGGRGAWLAAMLAPLLSVFVVRPWVPHPFPVWDYAEMLPLLRSSRGFAEAFTALASFYRAEGRANYLTYAQIAATWLIAGEHPVVWQLQRALFMLLAAILFVWVARRLGATPLAAGLGAALFSVAVPSTEGWLLLMGEPLAVILLLLLVGLSAGYRTSSDWPRRALLIALLSLGVMMTKEVLGLCLPVIVLFAVSWTREQGFARPTFGSRERRLAALLLLVLIIEFGSFWSAWKSASPESYANAYGAAGFELSRVGTLFQAMLFPARFTSSSVATLLYPANAAFLLLLILGCARPAVGGRRAPGAGWLALGLLSFPLLGAFAYALWPRYSAFYGIPFFAASAGLMVLALGGVERGQRSVGRWLAGGLGVIAVAFAAIVCSRVVQEKNVLAEIAHEVVISFPRESKLDTLFMVVPTRGGRRWPVNARELSHYAAAVNVPASAIPIVVDASCEDVGRRLGAPLGRSAILNDQNACGRLPAHTRRFGREVRYLDWLSGRTITDSVQVELLAPAWAKAAPPSLRIP
ncbi:MAG: hypothetical protein HOP28_12545 [Gemmatimonadales bacterium]|nr:hypothetical protein [Gemmatimonadales bacterium]